MQGNADRDSLLPAAASPPGDEREAQIAAINDWCRTKLGTASRGWLAALPASLSPAPGLLIVHGGLGGPDEIVDAEAQPQLPQGVSAVAAGHLHVPSSQGQGRGEDGGHK